MPSNQFEFDEYTHPEDNQDLLVIGQKETFSDAEMEAIAEMEKQPGAMVAPHTRSTTLKYRHVVTRIEIPLRAHHPRLYSKLMQLMRSADGQYWENLERGFTDRIMPEIEYIVYDTDLSDELPGIEPHVDDESVITLIVMLSERSAYRYLDPDVIPVIHLWVDFAVPLQRGGQLF
jgi:hypothetical protein